MVGRLVGQNRMASCASSMLATLLLISGMVYHVAGAGQIAFSHLPPGSLGKVRSSPVRSSLEGRRSPPIRGRKMAEDFSMAERGAGATTSVGGAHFWAETAGGTSAPPGELPASVEMPPALDAALEGGTAMGFTRREVVASKHAAPAWDKFDAAVPRPLSAFLATPSGMVDHFFKASSKTVARPSGRSKTLSRVGPDSDEETHFLSATIKDSAEGVSTGTLDTSEKAEPHVALQPGAPPPPAVHFSAAASGEVILGGAAPPVGVKVPAALEAALASGQMETLRAVEEDGGETHFAAGADGAGGRVTRGQPGEAKLPESLEMLLESESVSLDAPGAAKTSHFLGGGGAAPRGAPRGARMPKVLRDMVQRGPGVEAHHLVVPVAWERKATCPEGLLPAPRVPPALEAMVEALAKASLVARRSAKAAASTASVTRTLEAAKAREERRAAEVERVTLEKAFLLLSAAYPVAMERYMRSLVQGPSTQMRMAVRETLDAQVPGALSAYLLSLEGYLSVEGVVPPIVTPGKPAPGGIKVPAALKAMLYAGRVEPPFVAQEGGGGSDVLPGETMVPEALLALLESDSVSLNKPGSRAVAKVPAALGAMLDVAAASEDVGTVSQGLPEEATTPVALETMLESDSISLDKPGALESVSAPKSSVGGQAAGKVSREERPDPPAAARVPRVLQNILDAQAGMIVRPPVQAVVHHFLASTVEAVERGPALPPWAARVPEVLGVLLTPGDEVVVSRREEERRRVKAGVSMHFVAGALGQAGGVGSSAAPWQASVLDALEGLLESDSTSLERPWGSSVWLTQGGGAASGGASQDDGVGGKVARAEAGTAAVAKVPAALGAMLDAVAASGGLGAVSQGLPDEATVPVALETMLESESISLDKPGSRAVAKVPAALGAMLDVAAASEDVGTVSQGLPEEATTPVALETMLESDSISLDKPGALESVSAPKSSVGGQAAGKVSREERPDPPAAARVPRVLQNILDAQAGMIVRPPVQAVVHHFLASTVEAVERGPALPPWAARVPEVLGVLLTPGDEVVVSRREEERRRVKAGVSMHFVAGALGQAGGVGSSAAPWQASVPDALEGLLESDSTSLERPWGSSVWLTQGGGAGDDGAQGSPDAQTLSVDSGSPSVTLDARASAEVEILARIIVEEKLAAAQDLVARQDSATREGEPVLAAEEEPVAARAGSVEARAGWEAAKKQARDAVEEAGQAGYLEGFVDVLAIKGAERRAARLAQLGKVGVEEAAVVAGNDDDDDEKELFSDRDWEKVDSELVETEAEEAPKEPAGQLAMFGGKESPVVVLWKAVAAFFSGFSNSGRK